MIKYVKKLLKNDEIKKIGATLCHVMVIAHWIQFKFIIIWGNQKWNGARPAFIARAAVIIIFSIGKNVILWINEFIKKVTIIIIEAIAWIRKYLIADSVE